ncbi:piggyBac transposable element-derived protein 4-like protein [Lates japonicus]|uniref:PiggyBac transposable element-derived protein 4-like protein n=1 Tax=Lates japonicus TaxID=270547 RepID=A0AAD3N797_LATJO|nr:piggyBac transposable element-derived protein 4-like protein [Lates japonicus]
MRRYLKKKMGRNTTQSMMHHLQMKKPLKLNKKLCGDRKPAIILDYNHNKGGVDNLDKNEINPTWMPDKLNKRRVFLVLLGKVLVTPYIRRREHLPHTAASAAVVKAVQVAGSASAPAGTITCIRASECKNKALLDRELQFSTLGEPLCGTRLLVPPRRASDP